MMRQSEYYTKLAAYETDLIRADIPNAKTTTELAEILGMNRTTLIEKARKFGILTELPRGNGRPSGPYVRKGV